MTKNMRITGSVVWKEFVRYSIVSIAGLSYKINQKVIGFYLHSLIAIQKKRDRYFRKVTVQGFLSRFSIIIPSDISLYRIIFFAIVLYTNRFNELIGLKPPGQLKVKFLLKEIPCCFSFKSPHECIMLYTAELNSGTQKV